MSGEHNTNKQDLPELPSVGIIISGTDSLQKQKTVESIDNQIHKSYKIYLDSSEAPCKMFNSMEKTEDIYCFMRDGDNFVGAGLLKEVAGRMGFDKLIAGMYYDCYITEKEEVLSQIFLPPHDTETFPNLLGSFPIFVRASMCKDFPMDENLNSLYNHNLLLRLSSEGIIVHSPILGFSLKKVDMDLSKDLQYLGI